MFRQAAGSSLLLYSNDPKSTEYCRMIDLCLATCIVVTNANSNTSQNSKVKVGYYLDKHVLLQVSHTFIHLGSISSRMHLQLVWTKFAQSCKITLIFINEFHEQTSTVLPLLMF